MSPSVTSLFSYAFRPFFLLNGCFAIVIVAVWVLGLRGISVLGAGSPAPLWHAHEMLFGFGLAAVAGFSLTAVATWTGRAPIRGPLLAALVAVWLAGRTAMLWTAALPGLWLALVDLAFAVLLALVFAREVLAGGSRRNLPIVGIFLGLAALNLGYHLGTNQVWPGVERPAIYLAMHMLLLLITVIGGRIVPSFTANWLDTRGVNRRPVISSVTEKSVLLATAGVGVVASIEPLSLVTGGLALVASVLHGLRLARWCGWATRSEPLLMILHVAYAWLPLGYLLLAITIFDPRLPSTAAVHALSMGVIGSMILAVITRVALGHTGRPLHAARLTVLAYVLLTLAILARIVGPLTGPGYLGWIDAAALGWGASFALFVWVYWPILTEPRLDA